MGRVHEAQRHPTKFDNKGKLPDTKKLSGIRSKEVSGGGLDNSDLMIHRDKLVPNSKAVMVQAS